MPLLMCPNDNTAMQTLERGGVQFDMCPSCRGVWLDRGELEKLMESASAEGRASAPQAAPAPQPQAQQPYPPQGQPYPPQQQPQPWGNQGYRQDDRYRSDDQHRYKKKKRMDIFDIFD
jgi:Zn-finger nucleic acid-binding protein